MWSKKNWSSDPKRVSKGVMTPRKIPFESEYVMHGLLLESTLLNDHAERWILVILIRDSDVLHRVGVKCPEISVEYRSIPESNCPLDCSNFPSGLYIVGVGCPFGLC